MKRIAVLLFSLCLVCSCLPTVAGVAAYKIAQNKTQNNYREYVADMEKQNQVRKDAGQEPMKIKGFEEWKAAGR